MSASRKSKRMIELALKIQEHDELAAFHQAKSAEAREEFNLLADGPDPQADLAADIVNSDLSQEEKVLQLMGKKRERTWRNKELAAHLLLSATVVGAVLSRLTQSGSVKRVGRGLYKLRYSQGAQQPGD